tara:strand:+ start:479 stop:739 length:261 start_codon:yes stop_codon:yes gene_type:complete
MVGFHDCLGRIDMRFLKSLNFGTYFTMSEQENMERPSPASNPPQELSAEVIGSDTILQGKQEVLIQHGETTYRLRITQNGKLILCK